MLSSPLLLRRARLGVLVLTCSAPFAIALAQNPQAAEPTPDAVQQDPESAPGRQNQKIERIHNEDEGASIDELRVGGRTRDITVTPKNNAPAYQVMPNAQDGSKQSPSEASAGDGGSRVWWNLFKF